MAERVRWWVIPGALVVLLRVVTFDGTAPPAEPRKAVPVEAAARDFVVLRDAAGRRSPPVPAPGSTRAFVVTLPEAEVGKRGTMQIWRRVDGRREAEPAYVLRPRVRSDATVPFSGLPAGRYDVEMTFTDGGRVLRLCAQDAAAPGAVTLRAAP